MNLSSSHPDHEALGFGEVMRHWTLNGFVWLMLGAGASLYVAGVRRLWRHAGRGHGIGVGETAAYAAGIASLLVALVSPLDYLSDLSFFAHMSQHEILMLVSAPLIALGRPMIAAMWALPVGPRRALARLSRTSPARAAWRFVSQPLIVLLLHGVVVWLWHARPLFEAAMRDEWVHGLQHFSFFVTAMLFWWALVFGRYGRTGYGVAILFVFATTAHTSLLGALLTMGERVWYSVYDNRSPRVGLDALDDQRLAGLVMWIPGGAVFLIAALSLLLAWLGEARRRAEQAGQRLGEVDPKTFLPGTVIASSKQPRRSFHGSYQVDQTGPSHSESALPKVRARPQ
jgi:putative membrane protein